MNPKQRARIRRPSSLAEVGAVITNCNRCPRLRTYCQAVASEKRAAFRNWEYWGRPVPGFGDPAARILILGLAPAAHGANRTGRVFTGDGAGGSGDFLMAALHRAGYANLATSHRPDDGLELRGIYIAAAVRCAPPQNKPTPDEVTTCLDHLESELVHLPNVRTVIALGKIAWDAWLQLLARHAPLPRPRPGFAHGAVFEWTAAAALRPRRLVGCYHPSRQNTNTGVLTPGMYDEVFARVSIGD